MATKHYVSRLTHALNEMGQIVYVDDVPSGIHCKCFCPACNEQLIAKNQGTKRIHHFAHYSGKECDYAVESMLHRLAKERVREAFLSKSEYFIGFECNSYCKNDKTCKFIRHSKCCKKEIKRFDLKQFYDSCEQEIPYDKIHRRSDLKLFSSVNPDRIPIYIEFCVTHASDMEKLHSGNKIIEIKIETEEDIDELLKNGITQSTPSNPDKEITQEVSFYGFKREDLQNESISNEIYFVRCILDESGNTQCFYDHCNCKEITKSKPHSLSEICVHTSLDVKHVGFKLFGIANCTLCINYVDSSNGVGKICRLFNKPFQISCDKIDTSTERCRDFKIDQQKIGLLEKHSFKDCTILM